MIEHHAGLQNTASSCSLLGMRRVALGLAVIVGGFINGGFGAASANFGLGQDPIAPSGSKRSASADSPRAECRASALSIRLRHGIGAGPTVGGFLVFENRSKRDCTLSGWPSVRGIRGTGAPSRLAITVRTGPLGPFVSGIPKVVLAPGQRAAAVISAGAGANSGKGTCGRYRHLAVRAPESRNTVVVSAWITGLGAYLPACTRIAVSMIVRSSSLDLLSKH